MKIPRPDRRIETTLEASNAAHAALDLVKAIQAALIRGDLNADTPAGQEALKAANNARASVDALARQLETLTAKLGAAMYTYPSRPSDDRLKEHLARNVFSADRGQVQLWSRDRDECLDHMVNVTARTLVLTVEREGSLLRLLSEPRSAYSHSWIIPVDASRIAAGGPIETSDKGAVHGLERRFLGNVDRGSLARILDTTPGYWIATFVIRFSEYVPSLATAEVELRGGAVNQAFKVGQLAGDFFDFGLTAGHPMLYALVVLQEAYLRALYEDAAAKRLVR